MPQFFEILLTVISHVLLKLNEILHLTYVAICRFIFETCYTLKGIFIWVLYFASNITIRRQD